MGGTFLLGETKVRPGAYYNIQKKGGGELAGATNGIAAVIFKADFGPLNKVVELNSDEGYEPVFGNGLTTDAIKEAFAGGAKTVVACRVGTGGTEATVSLKDTAETPANAVTITAKYPGTKSFTVSVRTKLSDSSMKECVIYTGTAEFEKVEFAAGAGEASALVAAFTSSSNFTASVITGKESAIIAAVSQAAFTAGTNPTTTTSSYSDAFSKVEAYKFNVICVDTEDTAVHALLQSFVNRIADAGSNTIGVIAEAHSTALDTRMDHAAAFNDEKMVYVLNAYVNEQGTDIDGYQTAAKIAGMISAVSSASSLTHTVVKGFSELKEALTNTQITAAEKKGCLVLSANTEGQVWIDSAINTLVTPAANQDAGWKKIRRVKTRFELIERVGITTDNLVGKVDNDSNGRSTVISQIQAIGDAMVEEGKLIACSVAESSSNRANGDSAWFDIDVIDKDSMEHIYLTFMFRFDTNE